MKKGTIRSIPLIIIFSFITCGIYYLYWIYKTSEEIKNFTGREEINPALELLFAVITCNLYTVYWYYKYSKIVYKEMTLKAGMDDNEDNSVVFVALALFVQIIACAILQDKLNNIWSNVKDDEEVETKYLN